MFAVKKFSGALRAVCAHKKMRKHPIFSPLLHLAVVHFVTPIDTTAALLPQKP